MRAIPAILVAIIALMIAPQDAGAITFPGERLAHNATLNELVTLGEAYWHKRGVSPCAHPKVMLANDLYAASDGSPAYARTDGCTSWFLAGGGFSPLWDAQEHPRDVDAAAELCDETWHELGHSANLRFADNPADPVHSSDPDNIMYADGGPPPYGCVKWAQNRVRRYIRLHTHSRRHVKEIHNVR